MIAIILVVSVMLGLLGFVFDPFGLDDSSLGTRLVSFFAVTLTSGFWGVVGYVAYHFAAKYW